MKDASLSSFFANECSLRAVLFYQVVRDDFDTRLKGLLLEHSRACSTLAVELGASFAHLPLTSLCGLLPLFVYFQMKKGFWYFLVLSGLCSRLEWWSSLSPHPLTFLETLISACLHLWKCHKHSGNIHFAPSNLQLVFLPVVLTPIRSYTQCNKIELHTASSRVFCRCF